MSESYIIALPPPNRCTDKWHTCVLGLILNTVHLHMIPSLKVNASFLHMVTDSSKYSMCCHTSFVFAGRHSSSNKRCWCCMGVEPYTYVFQYLLFCAVTGQRTLCMMMLWTLARVGSYPLVPTSQLSQQISLQNMRHSISQHPYSLEMQADGYSLSK